MSSTTAAAAPLPLPSCPSPRRAQGVPVSSTLEASLALVLQCSSHLGSYVSCDTFGVLISVQERSERLLAVPAPPRHGHGHGEWGATFKWVLGGTRGWAGAECLGVAFLSVGGGRGILVRPVAVHRASAPRRQRCSPSVGARCRGFGGPGVL